MNVVLAFGGAQKLALVGVHAEAVAVRQSRGQSFDVLIADIEFASRDVREPRGRLKRIGSVVSAERGIEHPAVVDNVSHSSGLSIGSGVRIERILRLKVLHDANLALITTVVESDDGTGVSHHHVVHELERLVQAILLAMGPVAHDETALSGCRDLVKGEPVFNLSELAKAEGRIIDEGIDGRAGEETFAAVLIERFGSVEVIERDVGHDTATLAFGKERVVEVHTLLIKRASPCREDTRPGN